MASRLRADASNVSPSGAMSSIVETEERHPELLEELECGVHLLTRRLHRIDSVSQPGPIEGAGAEDVTPRPVEGMPEAHCGAEVILHPLPHYKSVGFVYGEGEVVVSVADPLAHLGKELGRHPPPSL